ncbi:uncharacterized protein LAESUDRAFT_715672 [Laetiporus sulphureus 93-53]|uniref:Uncharacterized protein n=1 Tax=Laetiporus sulphureus 93-53 TaxID=1314785 RepID=A0A165D9T5_9APHY|nr:uncharacterized protein LAESUDRAFT_715672 [Laetiporus sulphureus 93-53]KZT04399.1 hypothetical protein LAESUDRAFT_715672 [Laetiporus sulphureus 93-53]
MPADDKSLEAAEQWWKWTESVDGDRNLVEYWAAASGEAITNDEQGELRLRPILIMMPQPIPARQSYDSILHGKWGYQDINGKVVVLRKDEAQVLMNRVGGDTL